MDCHQLLYIYILVACLFKVDVDLAKQHADKPENNEELQRKLWLRIGISCLILFLVHDTLSLSQISDLLINLFAARHVVSEKQDVKRAMEFLHECDLLKIEDILPFFPDFVTIDHFKVCIYDY